MNSRWPAGADEAALAALETRLGHLHVTLRLGLEHDHEARVIRRRRHVSRLKRLYSVPRLIRMSLRLVGLYRRAQRNALAIELRENEVPIRDLPKAFDGYTILHISDPHFDINATFTQALQQRIQGLQYDLCVLTGDYRARTFGPIDPALAELRRLRPHIEGPLYAVLGNHDSIHMVPAMEAMGYRMLINESVRIDRGEDAIYLAGIDDAHFYRLENFQRAAHNIPRQAASILLSHTPEVFRHAAHAAFDFMLCGHTHGGQICLPGGVPVLTHAGIARRFLRGAWRYHEMAGYTSVGAGSCMVDVRLNCPPEVTLHRLRSTGSPP